MGNTAWKVSVFGVFLVRISCILTKYYSVLMWENTDQKNAKHEHLLRSENRYTFVFLLASFKLK